LLTQKGLLEEELYIEGLNKLRNIMKNKSFHFIFFLPLLIALSCDNGNVNLNKSNSEKAFAKIDLKNSNSFTKEERRKAYNTSLNSVNNKKSLLKKNVTYNGYGSSVKEKKKSNQKEVDVIKKKPKKKSAYRKDMLNSQIYSAYSTN